MKREKGFTPPFAVMRQIGTSMEDQLVSGFARTIRSGAYADGTVLPGVRKLAVMFGVSEITIRNAVKRLCRDGLLAARPRVGLTVCGGCRSWRGVVVGLRAAHDSGMYYANVLEGTIASALMRSGWLFAKMEWPGGSGGADILEPLKCFAPAMAVAPFPSSEMLRALDRSGIPFAVVWPLGKTVAKARFQARISADSALAELARRFAACGVSRVLSVYQHVSGVDFTTALRNAGLSVRKMHVPPLNGYIQSESVQRAALETFDRLLSRGALDADAIVFNDDYLAAGALSAFERHGVRMPEDIRVVTLSNHGLGPVHFRPLTRIVVDPVRDGQKIAENVLRILDGKDVPQKMNLEMTFKKGETA